MKRLQRLTNETKQQIKDLAQQGLTLDKIAQTLGISRSSVGRHTGRPLRRRGLPIEKQEKIKELYLQGVEVKAIAEQVGCCQTTVCAHARRACIAPRRKGRTYKDAMKDVANFVRQELKPSYQA
jgi:DNA-binding NarL/FixJ family response regulator